VLRHLYPEGFMKGPSDKGGVAMRKICLLLVLSLPLLSGCAESSDLIKKGSSGVTSDVFQEMPEGGTTPQGHADLRILSTLKMHKPGIYPFDKKAHGTPDYQLLVNIDGQLILVRGELEKEQREPRGLHDPEAGDGIRYRFGKNLRLKAGRHSITVGLPVDRLAVAREITLADGSRNR